MKNLYLVHTDYHIKHLLVVADNKMKANEVASDNLCFGEAIASCEFICVACGDFDDDKVIKIIE